MLYFKKVDNIASEFSLQHLIDTPTRISENRSSLLDIILTNIKNVYKSGIPEYNISNHLQGFLQDFTLSGVGGSG